MGDKRRGQLAPAARSATLPTTGETTETESLFFSWTCLSALPQRSLRVWGEGRWFCINQCSADENKLSFQSSQLQGSKSSSLTLGRDSDVTLQGEWDRFIMKNKTKQKERERKTERETNLPLVLQPGCHSDLSLTPIHSTCSTILPHSHPKWAKKKISLEDKILG